MPDDIRHNGRDSATTSANKPAADLSETEYLNREADDAREAISQTIAQMREALGEAGDVRAWTRRYPWAALGASVAAGFVVAAAILPGKRRRHEDQEPALLERILADEKIAARLKELAAEDNQRSHSSNQILQSVAGTLWKTFAPAVQSAIAAAIAARAAQEPQNPPSDGQACADEPQAEAYDAS